MSSRISPWLIITSHISTLYNYGIYIKTRQKRTTLGDLFIFVILPTLISATITFLKITITQEFINIILTCLSIFAGLLFGLLPLVFQITKELLPEFERLKALTSDEKYEETFVKIKNQLLISKELFANISFSILLSLISIITILLTQFRPTLIITYLKDKAWFSILKNSYLITINFFSNFWLILFLMTLLMVLKRFYLIYKSQISSIETELD